MASEPGDARGDESGRPPVLDALTRERLGRYLQEIYEPVVDEALDPRLAELMQALEQARTVAR
ncbi:hypothetical protein [Methylobacterium durans]|uniref:Anti-sigma factor NepR domain-containing protein n=1 Tax=Methylobacterium durans TaxID=2202825 RepID=A0A2U8WBA8_9HYPH|nr:hypothetical protein [Methylobacterium durans]AWN43445.1 hypothetical protein DK389_26710 [Methylobacterium durans]